MSLSIKRKKTRRIMVGGVAVGDGAPISVQSMTNTKTDDVTATVRQIRQLEQAGCEIVRVAVPDQTAADAIGRIKAQIAIPLVADIHFDHRLAIASARAGADGLRFNPGNIGSRKHIKALVDCARECRIPIRIGVNAGSLEKDILETYQGANRCRHGRKRPAPCGPFAGSGFSRHKNFHQGVGRSPNPGGLPAAVPKNRPAPSRRA
jgi:(E)-4-hydroxy-3-methylbut-2-enyl-diphosphate synthase